MKKSQSRVIPVKNLLKKLLQPTMTLQNLQKSKYINISIIFHSLKAPLSSGVTQTDYGVSASHVYSPKSPSLAPIKN